MPVCECCGNGKDKQNKVKQYHFSKKLGGTKTLCPTCYKNYSREQNKHACIEQPIPCPSCRTPIYTYLHRCPICHNSLEEIHESVDPLKLRDRHMRPWNTNDQPIKSEQKSRVMSDFTIKKPIFILLASFGLLLLILVSILYLPAIADEDDEQFYGIWKGDSGMVIRTTWDFDDDHTVKITIDRGAKKTYEYYKWDITDHHIRFTNLPKTAKHYTDINASAFSFLPYDIPFTYDFTITENAFTLGIGKTEFAVGFIKT